MVGIWPVLRHRLSNPNVFFVFCFLLDSCCAPDVYCTIYGFVLVCAYHYYVALCFFFANVCVRVCAATQESSLALQLVPWCVFATQPETEDAPGNTTDRGSEVSFLPPLFHLASSSEKNNGRRKECTANAVGGRSALRMQFPPTGACVQCLLKILNMELCVMCGV